MERAGMAEDLAGTAIFLASSASDYVTGQVVFVDDGWLSDYVTGQVVFIDGGSLAGSFSDKNVGKKGCFIAGGGMTRDDEKVVSTGSLYA